MLHISTELSQMLPQSLSPHKAVINALGRNDNIAAKPWKMSRPKEVRTGFRSSAVILVGKRRSSSLNNLLGTDIFHSKLTNVGYVWKILRTQNHHVIVCYITIRRDTHVWLFMICKHFIEALSLKNPKCVMCGCFMCHQTLRFGLISRLQHFWNLHYLSSHTR